MPRIVNKGALLEILGVSHQTICNWQDEGMPVLTHGVNGSSNEYDVPACIRWWIAKEVAKVGGNETPRNRLARVQADRIELEIAETRRELIPASDVGQEWSSAIIAARQAMLVIPQNVAPLCVGMDDPDPIRELLQDAIEEALSRLAEDDQPDALPGPETSDVPLGSPAPDVAVGLGGEEPGDAGREPDTGPVPLCAHTVLA